MTEVQKLVATLLVLRQKCHSFHWNVTGSSFLELHNLFASQYEKILSSVDQIGEYMRSTGEYPPSTLENVLELSQISEIDSVEMDALDMVKDLYVDFSKMEMLLNSMNAKDRSLNVILDDLALFFSKQRYILRSYFE